MEGLYNIINYNMVIWYVMIYFYSKYFCDSFNYPLKRKYCLLYLRAAGLTQKSSERINCVSRKSTVHCVSKCQNPTTSWRTRYTLQDQSDGKVIQEFYIEAKHTVANYNCPKEYKNNFDIVQMVSSSSQDHRPSFFAAVGTKHNS